MKKSIVLVCIIFTYSLVNAQQIGNGVTAYTPDFAGLLNSGGYESATPTDGVPDNSGSWQHLFVLRHSNPNNNHQFQLGTTYTENDRLFFRKIANGLAPKSTNWNELATRGSNTFTGNQTINGALTLNNGITFNHQRINFSANPRTTISPMSIKLWDNYNNGGPTTYGTVMEIYGYDGHQTSQLYFGGSDNSRIRYRESFYGQNTWNDWITLLDSKNDIESQGNLKVSGSGKHYIQNGDVGIGTNTPNAKLDVVGNARFQSDISVFGSGDCGSQLHLFNTSKTTNGQAYRWSIFNMTGAYGNSLQFWFYDKLGSTFQEGGRWGEVLTLMDNGNVGIGTSSANIKDKLTVNGAIHASEVKVDLNNLADFVFDENYKLMPLHQVEQYVKINNHLPEIPSAAEVSKNGLSVGEMQNKLLQKIEELTLYVIKQQKEIEELKKNQK